MTELQNLRKEMAFMAQQMRVINHNPNHVAGPLVAQVVGWAEVLEALTGENAPPKAVGSEVGLGIGRGRCYLGVTVVGGFGVRTMRGPSFNRAGTVQNPRRPLM